MATGLLLCHDVNTAASVRLAAVPSICDQSNAAAAQPSLIAARRCHWRESTPGLPSTPKGAGPANVPFALREMTTPAKVSKHDRAARSDYLLQLVGPSLSPSLERHHLALLAQQLLPAALGQLERHAGAGPAQQQLVILAASQDSLSDPAFAAFLGSFAALPSAEAIATAGLAAALKLSDLPWADARPRPRQPPACGPASHSTKLRSQGPAAEPIQRTRPSLSLQPRRASITGYACERRHASAVKAARRLLQAARWCPAM